MLISSSSDRGSNSNNSNSRDSNSNNRDNKGNNSNSSGNRGNSKAKAIIRVKIIALRDASIRAKFTFISS